MSEVNSFFTQYLSETARVTLSLAQQSDQFNAIATTLVQVAKQGGTIYSCGNGGSTCDALHITEELVARYKRERPGIRAQHFCDAATLTCWSNDYNFDGVFARQVETHLTKDDALLVFTTSGNSKNILAALEAAKKVGAKRIAFLGKGGGKAKALADLAIVVESETTAHIQEAHMTLVHTLCDVIENQLFPLK